MFKICLLTDLHIDMEGFIFNGINARTNFINVLNEAVTKSPEIIILAGDLCNKQGSIEIYQWVKSKMDSVGIPYYCIPGNHDNSIILKDIFHNDVEGSSCELFYVKEIQGHTLVFLDTSLGSMSERQYDWLREVVTNIKGDVTIFMHHPPVLAMVKHMEPKYAFQQMDIFQTFCAAFPDKKFHIFTGHYHFERTIALGNITTYISPSTYLQIHPDSEEFKIYSDRIGYREIRLTDSSVVTNVNYL